MSRSSRRQRPNPAAEELADQVSRLPRDLGIWRAGQHGLYHLLFSSSLARFTDLAQAQLTAGDLGVAEAMETWRHATSALVEWHTRWAKPGSGEPADQDLAAAIRRARDWRALETIQLGLRTGDMYIAGTSGWEIRLGNIRDHAVEVLDIILQQVSIPAPKLTGPSDDAVQQWFTGHAGRPGQAHRLPKWVQTIAYRRAQADLVNRDFTMPGSTDLGGLTLAEARDCYALLLARTELAALCTTVLGSRETAVWYTESAALIKELTGHVSAESAAAFIQLCSYHPGRSPASAPLIPDDNLIAIPSALVSPVGFERALLRAASADPSRAGQLGNTLGRRSARWADLLRSIPGAQVAERLPVTSDAGQALGDLDVAAFDAADNLLLVVETKWPVDAHTLRESSKIDDAVEAGRHQLLRVKAALANGGTARWPRTWHITPGTRITWWVATAQQLSTRPGRDAHDIRATSLRLIEHILPASSVADLQERVENFPLPRLGVEYELTDQTVRVGRYRITIPAIALLGEPPVPPEDRRTNTGWT